MATAAHAQQITAECQQYLGAASAAAAAANRASQVSSGNATRDRLRRKLDAKKNASK